MIALSSLKHIVLLTPSTFLLLKRPLFFVAISTSICVSNFYLTTAMQKMSSFLVSIALVASSAVLAQTTSTPAKAGGAAGGSAGAGAGTGAGAAAARAAAQTAAEGVTMGVVGATAATVAVAAAVAGKSSNTPATSGTGGTK